MQMLKNKRAKFNEVQMIRRYQASYYEYGYGKFGI